jgi:hypothetical protein
MQTRLQGIEESSEENPRDGASGTAEETPPRQQAAPEIKKADSRWPEMRSTLRGWIVGRWRQESMSALGLPVRLIC